MNHKEDKMLIVCENEEKLKQCLKDAEEILKKYMPEKYKERFKLVTFKWESPTAQRGIEPDYIIVDEVLPLSKECWETKLTPLQNDIHR